MVGFAKSKRPLLYIYFTISVLLLLSPAPALCDQSNDDDMPDESFFLHCSGGEIKQLKEAFQSKPHWVHATTKDGESCLHLAGILGHASVTKLLLDLKADPNVRSTFEQGLRMHPLSWNVYANHYDNCQLLLEHGADVNADFDLVIQQDKTREVVTVLNIIHRMKEGGNHDFDKLEKLLLKHGAKTWKELPQ